MKSAHNTLQPMMGDGHDDHHQSSSDSRDEIDQITQMNDSGEGEGANTSEPRAIEIAGHECDRLAAPRRSAWYEWLSEHGSRMLLFARSQTRNTQDAEDVLQDSLVKLARMVDEGSFEGGREQWRPFLYTTIRRRAIDLGRKSDRRSTREKKSEEQRLVETGSVSDPWFESGNDHGESSAQLEEGLRKLPEKFSEVIVMKIWGEQTFAQIADSLDISLSTVASRYRYGLERMRKSLESNRALSEL